MRKIIYLDNAATTKTDPAALEAMIPYFCEHYGNPASHHDIGYEVSDIVEESRRKIAATIGCKSSEIYFTSGGTESDNWALRMVRPGHHIITSAVEHHAILNTCKYLESQGVEVTYIYPDAMGLIHPEDIELFIQKNTFLISIMAANNEIGTIQPLRQVSDLAAEHNILFHTDAVQAYGHIDLDVNMLGVDLMSASAHKMGGPKGIGFLYVSDRVPMKPLIYGGGQQLGFRSGTENVPGIVGFAKAAEIACDSATLWERFYATRTLRDYFISCVKAEIPDVQLNGHQEYRLPNNANFSFYGVRGEVLLTLLNENGICASTGSACNSDSDEPSHVLLAIGCDNDAANGSIRFTLSHSTTMKDIDYVVGVLKRSVEQLRNIYR